MIICAAILLALCIYKMKFAKFHCDYMCMDQTGSIKGIFAVIIFLSHIRQYSGIVFSADTIVIWVLNRIGQLMVTLFFFYSGFGVLRSYEKKREYSNNFFKNRIFKTWIHFATAVMLYFILSLIIGKKYQLTDYLFAWVGWTALGNSNWFVFVMLSLYVVTWFVFLLIGNRFAEKRNVVLAIGVSVLSCALWLGLFFAGKQSLWYNTLLCYPFGMWFGVFKQKFDNLISNFQIRIGIILVVACVFAVLYLVPNVAAYSLCACLFCLLVTLLTTMVKFDNNVLRWLGKYSFEIYIIQRIPMIILSECGMFRQEEMFFLLTILTTGLLAVVLKKVYFIVDPIFSRGRNQSKV